MQTTSGEYWGRRIRFPGSTKVYDRSTRQLVTCTPGTCPKAIKHSTSDDLVNYAPFFAEGGEAYAIRAGAAAQKKSILFDLMAWFATLPIDVLPLTGIYRTSQLSEPSKERLVSSGWPRTMVDDLFNVLRFYFLDDDNGGGNGVKDLLIPGFSEYMGALDEELYQKFLLNLTVSFGGITGAQYDNSFDVFASQLMGRLSAITAKYGKLNQLKRWRKAMNMQSLSPAQLCAWPDRSALTPSEASQCTSAGLRSCTETGCGKYAECLADQTESSATVPLCTCTSEDTTPREDFLTSRACVPTVASTDQQRIFWTLSMLLFGVGFVLSLVVINEFLRNPLFSPSRPGGNMWSFAAIAVPDFVLSTTYFSFHFTNLLNGVEMAAGPCDGFALLTTMGEPTCGFYPPRAHVQSQPEKLATSDVNMIQPRDPLQHFLPLRLAIMSTQFHTIPYRTILCQSCLYPPTYYPPAAVYATLLGPPIVALATLRSFIDVATSMTKVTPKLAVAVTLSLPWGIGLVIGLISRADGSEPPACSNPRSLPTLPTLLTPLRPCKSA